MCLDSFVPFTIHKWEWKRNEVITEVIKNRNTSIKPVVAFGKVQNKIAFKMVKSTLLLNVSVLTIGL